MVMSTSNLQLNIRNAKSEDFPVIGKLNASALAGNQFHQTVMGKVDPEVTLKWEWIDTAGPRVASGKDTLLVLERSDTKEIVGFVWFWKFSQEGKPVLASGGWCPEGFDDKVDMKISVARFEWQNDLLNEFGEFICEFLSRYWNNFHV